MKWELTPRPSACLCLGMLGSDSALHFRIFFLFWQFRET